MGKRETISTTDVERDGFLVVCLIHNEKKKKKNPNSKPTPNNCNHVASKRKPYQLLRVGVPHTGPATGSISIMDKEQGQ